MKLIRAIKHIFGLGLVLLIFVNGISIWSKGSAGVMAQSTPSQSLPRVMAGLTPSGWEIFDKVKQFTPENLYEQINGRAEFFIAYDMIRMTFVSFIKSADKEKFIDLSIYDMGNPTNAFGVYSGERSQGELPLNLGRAGYTSDANYYIWKGQYYIKIIASDITDEFKSVGLDIARKVTKPLFDSGEQVWGLIALPRKDRVPESVQYFKVDAMGLDFMQNTYTARYRKGSAMVTTFLSKRDTPETIKAAVVQYNQHAKRYGKGVERLKIEDVEMISCDMGGDYDIIFQKGCLMGGVLSVKDRDLAVQAAIDFWKQLHY